MVKEYDAEILKESCPQEFLDLKTEDVNFNYSTLKVKQEDLWPFVSDYLLQVIVWVDPLDGTAEFTEGR